MKDSLFEMLLNLFEKTLAQLKEKHVSAEAGETDHEKQDEAHPSPLLITQAELPTEFIKSAQLNSIRVFTSDEQIKLTKASYQFLMRMSTWGIITPELLELIVNQLIFSESRFVDLQETKWTIRNTLAETLNAEQLAFLDLVLYQREDELPLH